MKTSNRKFKGLLILLPAIMLYSLTSCDKEDNDNPANTDQEPEVNNYVMVATGQTTLYDNDVLDY